MRLLGVELSRLRRRRAYVVLMLAGLVLVGLVMVGEAASKQPPSAVEVRHAEALAEREAGRRWVQREIERCEEGRGQYPPGFDCERLIPTADDFLYAPTLVFSRGATDLLMGIAVGLALLALLIGATFVGAEWAAGTVGTLLVFEPRRSRVWLAKAGAVLLGTAVPAAVLIAVGFVGRYGFAQAWGNATVRDGFLADLAGQGARAVAFVTLASLGGYAVAMATRHTAAALGAVLAYLLIGEVLMRVLGWMSAERWLLSNHVNALIGGEFRQRIYPANCIGDCRPEVIVFTTPGAAAYLAALTGLALAVSWALFRRRDVA